LALDHEYALLGGYNRTHLGRWLFMAAAGLSALLVFVLLSAVDLADRLGLPVNLPPSALSLLGAGTLYLALYFLFDRYFWKVGFVAKAMKLPDLSGVWRCEGLSRDKSPPVPWFGRVTITQSWDRVRVHLINGTSESNSVAAALQADPVGGHRLMYHYKNQPRQNNTGLQAHHGFADLAFADDGLSARGEYFNGRGRNTFGDMTLTKET